MKTNAFWTIFFSLILSIGTVACGDAGNNMEDAEEDLESAGEEIGDAFRAEQEELQANINDTQQALQEEMEEIEANMENASAEARAEMQEEYNELEAWNNELGRELEQVEQTSEEGWNNFKTNVDRTLGEIDRELSDNDYD